MAGYDWKTYDRALEEELLKSRYGLLMKQRDEAIANNNATGKYADWNGGSVSGQQFWDMTQDALKYGYDVMLDPRNNGGAREAIGDVLSKASEQANADAIAGIGDYDTNRQNYLNQIGWTDYQNVFKNLQENGTLGLKSLDGRSLEEAYGLGATQVNGNPMTGFSLEERLASELASLPTQEQLYREAMAAEQQAYLDAHLSPLMNQQGGSGQGGAWGYDMEGDPVWQAYLKQYSRAADKGMNDTLAQLSARTGGMASSYAGQVAQQTHNDIMQGATDMIPQLEQQAYDRDLTERQMAIDAEQRQYERQMAAEQQQYERMMAQQQMAADQQAQNANLLLSLMESYGYVPSEEELRAAGLDPRVADAVGTAYQNNLALEWQKVNKTTGGKPVTPTITDAIYQQMADAGLSEGEAYAHLRGTYGLDDDEAVPYIDYYREFLEGQTPVVEETVDLSGAMNQVYEGLGGKTLGEFTHNAEIYKQVLQHAEDMLKAGYTKEEVLDFLRITYAGGELNDADYATLIGRYK